MGELDRREGAEPTRGGSITSAEAAMETSLTVREADQMLSELAGGGHLTVESKEGSLFYALPRRRGGEIGSRE
jgi:hypothetical protein